MSDLRLRIFDGKRELFSASANFIVTVTDGRGTQHPLPEFQAPTIDITNLPCFDNEADNYSVVVSTDGYRQAGFQPKKLHGDTLNTLDVMLIPNHPGFSFVNARWPFARAAYPFLAADADNATAQARYEQILEAELPLACFLNLAEAMSQATLRQGTPLDYLHALRWDLPYAPRQDRFFAWCDKQLIDQMLQAEREKAFAQVPCSLHPGATRSWKQLQFGGANVQLTFHENDHHPAHPDWIVVEPDIDYYSNPLNHIFLEVLPNRITHQLTDPIMVYLLRWIAGRNSAIPEFAPLYTLT